MLTQAWDQLALCFGLTQLSELRQHVTRSHCEGGLLPRESPRNTHEGTCVSLLCGPWRVPSGGHQVPWSGHCLWVGTAPSTLPVHLRGSSPEAMFLSL